ncbi:hypothetical protein MRX96_031792 [Rhipicephalus microplus]
MGPFLCILGVPLVGAWSDRCRSRLGRRRPFLLGLGALLSLALAAIAFADLIFAPSAHGPVLAVATIVLDFATQALLNPSQSLLYDLVADVDYGFSVYSFSLSLGGLFGYLLSALDWTGTALGNAGQERAVFLLMLVALITCLAVTSVLAKEKPLPPVKPTESMANGDAMRSLPPSTLVILDKGPQGGVTDNGLPVTCNGNAPTIGEPGTPSHNHSPLHGSGVFITWHHVGSSKAKASPAKVVRALSSALLVIVCEAFCRVCSPGWPLFAHYVYFTDFTGEVVYHGRPEETASNDDRSRYDRGVRAGSWGLLVNCIASSAYSLTIQWRVTSRFGQRFGLLLGMGTFAAAMPGLLPIHRLGQHALTVCHDGHRDCGPRLHSICARLPLLREQSALLATAEYLSQVILTPLMGCIFSATHTVASYVAVAVVCALASCYASTFIACPSPKDTS